MMKLKIGDYWTLLCFPEVARIQDYKRGYRDGFGCDQGLLKDFFLFGLEVVGGFVVEMAVYVVGFVAGFAVGFVVEI